MFEKINKLIDKLYRPLAEWLISLNNKHDIDWLNMHENMLDDKEKKWKLVNYYKYKALLIKEQYQN